MEAITEDWASECPVWWCPRPILAFPFLQSRGEVKKKLKEGISQVLHKLPMKGSGIKSIKIIEGADTREDEKVAYIDL